MRIIFVVLAGFLLDCLLGDPHNPWHPVCLIGRLITGLEKKLRSIFPQNKKGELSGGLILVLLVLAISTVVPLSLLVLAGMIHPGLSMVLEAFMCYQLLAARSLRDESMKVYEGLNRGDREEARRAVSMIVGRETAKLDEAGIARAAVETVAENSSDGVIAPMIYMAIGGAPLGFFYKAVNTMDSMVGYKNDRYLYFGRAAAKLDDLMNYIPSRLSGLLIVAAAAITGMNAKGAMRIFLRDRRKHASPNSAQTEAACAGALGLRLAGDAWYFGELYHKPYIGDNTRPVEARDIIRANRLMYGASVLCLGLCLAVRFMMIIFV
ncbi:MAG: adenosylcobinamide-phosphate synthase CbiB [Coprococcus sp.]